MTHWSPTLLHPTRCSSWWTTTDGLLSEYARRNGRTIRARVVGSFSGLLFELVYQIRIMRAWECSPAGSICGDAIVSERPVVLAAFTRSSLGLSTSLKPWPHCCRRHLDSRKLIASLSRVPTSLSALCSEREEQDDLVPVLATNNAHC